MDFIILTSVLLLILINGCLLLVLIMRKNKSVDNVGSSRINDMYDKLIKLESEITIRLMKHTSDNFIALNTLIKEQQEKNIDNANKHYRDQNQMFVDKVKELNEAVQTQFKEVNSVMKEKIEQINKQVNEQLDKGFLDANTTFKNVLESIARIEEAKEKMASLSIEVGNLNQLFDNSKQRGRYGEFQLKSILDAVFEGNSNLYATQYEFKVNNKSFRPDAVIFTNDDYKMICIDSKFPFDNYKKYLEQGVTLAEFRKNVLDQVEETAKYIIPGYTFIQAFMFIPSDGLLAFIYDQIPEIITKAQAKHVALLSPSTLLPALAAIRNFNITMERAKQINKIEKEISKLGKEFTQFASSWTKYNKSVRKVLDEGLGFDARVEKLTQNFNRINNVLPERKELKNREDIAQSEELITIETD